MDSFSSITDIQRNIATRLQSDMSMDKTIELLSIIQGMVTDKFGRIDKEAILLEAQFAGMSSEEANSLLKTLIRNRTLKEDGHYVKF